MMEFVATASIRRKEVDDEDDIGWALNYISK